MLFRVGVVTLLLAAAIAAQLSAPGDAPTTHVDTALIALIATTYGLTIVFALALRRGAGALRSARVQLAIDLVLVSAAVHLTGGTESAFVFMYLLAIVGASYVLGRDALWVAGAAVALYAAMIIARRFGLLPLADGAPLPLRAVARVVVLNGVAILATGALAARLAVELERAGESIRAQGGLLRDLTALHQDVVRCLSSGLITLGVDARVLTYNAAAAELLGLDATAPGRRIDELVPALTPVLAEAEAGPVRRGEVEHEHHGERRVLGISLSPLTDANGQLVGRILNFQDVTALRDMELKVRRAERLAAVGRLAAGIAHEIRNPLAAISGSVELLAQSAPPGHQDAELMAIVLREAARLNALITDLLQFARPRSPELVRMDLAHAAGEIVRVIENDRQLDGARVELDAPRPVWVDADPAHVRQVLWNLLRNAAEASPTGEPIRVSVAREAERARLTVRDRGPGIPAEHRARIFEPFFSTKAKGTGLGLATVHRIVEEHHGSIAVTDADGGGALFTVLLPAGAQPN
jgi:two-component system, NtrC family, sensor histidine kinase PilS